MKPYFFIPILLFLFSCKNKNENTIVDENKNSSITLRTLRLINNNYVSLCADTLYNEKTFSYSFFLKDKYKVYKLNSYFNIDNIKYNGGELILKKDVYSNNNTGNGFVLKFLTRDYLSYTFLEYKDKSLFVKSFIEIYNRDNKIIIESHSENDTIYMSKCKLINIDANIFFNKSFVFDSMMTKNIKYNFLNRKNEWLNKPDSRQEEWALKHFLYESE